MKLSIVLLFINVVDRLLLIDAFLLQVRRQQQIVPSYNEKSFVSTSINDIQQKQIVRQYRFVTTTTETKTSMISSNNNNRQLKVDNNSNTIDIHHEDSATTCLPVNKFYESNNNNNDNISNDVSRRGWFKKMIVLSSLCSTASCLQSENKYAWAVTYNSNNVNDDNEFTNKLKSSLQPATQSMPAIPFPTSRQNENDEVTKAGTSPTSIEGLLYLKNQRQQRPNFNDRIVILVSTIQQPNIYLAGAQIPISRISSFPFRFRISEQNILPVQVIVGNDNNKNNNINNNNINQQQKWNTITSQEDLLVSAVVCTSDQDMIPTKSLQNSEKWVAEFCQIQSKNNQIPQESDDRILSSYPSIRAQGVSKLLRLAADPETLNSNESPPAVVIRIPVSLGLQ